MLLFLHNYNIEKVSCVLNVRFQNLNNEFFYNLNETVGAPRRLCETWAGPIVGNGSWESDREKLLKNNNNLPVSDGVGI